MSSLINFGIFKESISCKLVSLVLLLSLINFFIKFKTTISNDMLYNDAGFDSLILSELFSSTNKHIFFKSIPLYE